jgi:hypothetical protein
MIDKKTQRMIKEGLIRIFTDRPDIIDFPVYYLPLNDPTETESLKQLGLTIRTLHDIPELPWPDENCIICTEDHMSAILDFQVKPFIFLVHEKKMNDRFNLIPRHESMGFSEYVTAYVLFNVPDSPHALRSFSQVIILNHMDFSGPTTVRPNLKQSMEKEIEKLSDSSRLIHFHDKASLEMQGIGLTNEQKQRLQTYWMSYASTPLKNAWTAKELGKQAIYASPFEDSQIGLASDILAYLSNIAVPCHYFVRSRFKDGFGISSMRRVTRDKPIFSVLSYDRLYRTFIEPLGDMGDLTPHFRRGHIRYFWQKSGINRHSLPDNPFERLKIAHARHVERTYVTPAWVGEKTYLRDGVEHEIVTDDIPLRVR